MFLHPLVSSVVFQVAERSLGLQGYFYHEEEGRGVAVAQSRAWAPRDLCVCLIKGVKFREFELELTMAPLGKNYTRNEWRRCKTTLETSGEDAKLHSKRVEKTDDLVKSNMMSCDPHLVCFEKDFDLIKTLGGIEIKLVSSVVYIFPTRFECDFPRSLGRGGQGPS